MNIIQEHAEIREIIGFFKFKNMHVSLIFFCLTSKVIIHLSFATTQKLDLIFLATRIQSKNCNECKKIIKIITYILLSFCTNTK